MKGSWHRYRPGEPWRLPQRRASAILETAEAVAVAFDTPVVELLTDADLRRSPALTALGPDLLGAEFDLRRGAATPARAGRRGAGNALLDQHAVAGIGNAYKSEVAFLERLDPWAPVAAFEDDELAAALRTARRLLQANTRGGRTGHYRQPGPRPGAVGLRPSRAAVSPMRHAHPPAPAGRARPADVLVPALPAREGYASIRLIIAPIATSFASICS